MKLTYNNGETIVTVEGTQEEVFVWYKTFVHSETACEQNMDTAFVELINRKTYEEECNKAVNNVNNRVNDSRAGEPDEDGWMTWLSTPVNTPPKGVCVSTQVDVILTDGDGGRAEACDLNWSNDTDFPIVSFRIVF